jgi:type IV pilus assembly protein PilQ
MRKVIFLSTAITLLLGLVSLVSVGLVAQEENSAPGWEKLTDVKIQKVSETKSNIIIATTGPIKYHCFKITNPPRLVVEMTNTVDNWKQKEIEIGNFLIKRIRSGQYQGEPVKITRVVLDLVKPVDYESTATEKEIILTIFGKQAIEGVEKEVPKIVKVETEKEPKITKKMEIARNIEDEEHKSTVEEIKKEESERRVAELPTVEKKGRQVAIGELIGPISQEPVSLDFVDADIAEVIRFFALKTEMNFVLAEGVAGKVVIHLHNVPFDEALKAVLEQKGLIAIQYSENVIKIVDKTKMPTFRKTFLLNIRNASDLKGSIDKALTDEEKKYTIVGVSDVPNALIVTSTAEGIEKLSKLIEELDVKMPQIKIMAKILEVDITNGVDLGINWSVTKTFSGSPQFGKTTVTGNTKSMTSPFTLSPTPTGFSTLDIATIISGAELDLTLTALAAKTKTKSLSNPTLVVENARPAHIHVGDTIPYLETVVQVGGGSTQTMGTVEIGTTLDVTPTVSPMSKEISLNVSVAVKSLVALLPAGPQTTDRLATTKVTISEGQTVVVGGLVSDIQNAITNQVPVLGDIPVLGYLFKMKETQTRRVELLIFLTPQVASE